MQKTVAFPLGNGKGGKKIVSEANSLTKIAKNKKIWLKLKRDTHPDQRKGALRQTIVCVRSTRFKTDLSNRSLQINAIVCAIRQKQQLTKAQYTHKIMPAIGYHFSAKTISRTRGQSAIASVSYRTAEKLKDERLDQTFDYTRKQGVEFVYHAVPQNAVEWAHDIEKAWNEIERVENRKNSTVAREFEVAFPHQLDEQQREYILKDFVREEFTRKGFMATAAIHSPSPDGDERNYHAHIMIAERQLDENGFSTHKDRRFSSYETRTETLEHLKEKWAELGARQLERAGFEIEAERWRHGHKTLDKQHEAALARSDIEYAEQCDREPTKHLGITATAIEREGKESERGDLNRAIESRNDERQEIKQELASIQEQRTTITQEYEAPSQTRSDDRGADPSHLIGQGLSGVLQAVETLAIGLESFLFSTSPPEPKVKPPIQPPPVKTADIQKQEANKQAQEFEQNQGLSRENLPSGADEDYKERIKRMWEEQERQRSQERGHER